MTRILLLSIPAGAGHGPAAEALRAEAAASFPARYADYYSRIVEHHPAVWV